jgi:hypothetical protein
MKSPRLNFARSEQLFGFSKIPQSFAVMPTAFRVNAEPFMLLRLPSSAGADEVVASVMSISTRSYQFLRRCPQVERITMDMSLVDVTALGGQVALGDKAVIIGRQGAEEISADGLAAKLGTINYEIVTAIAHGVPRVAVAHRVE